MGQWRTGEKVRLCAKLALTAACYLLAVRYNAYVQSGADIVTVSLEKNAVSVKTAEEICRMEQEQEKPLAVCFWGEQPEIQFTCRETGKSTEAAALLVEGNPELAAGGSAVLAWQDKGCIVDEATARELFGTEFVDGQTLWQGDTAYTVYGTFGSLRRTVVLRGVTEPWAQLDMVSVRIPTGKNIKSTAEQFLMRSGLSGTTMDFVFPGMLSANMLLLLPLLLAAGLIRFVWSGIWEGPSMLKRAGCAVLLLLSAAVLLLTVLHGFQFPADMVPTRWSDFSFWTDWWKTQKQNLLLILGGAQGEAQLLLLWNFILSVLCSAASAGFGLSVLHSGE